MKSSALVFLAAFAALAASWGGLVLAPQLQLGRSQQTKTLSGEWYPQTRPGLARQGLEVYRANGCMYCHTQQVRQEGARCEIVLTEPGTNAATTVMALVRLNPELGKLDPVVLLGGLPKTVLTVPDMNAAEPALKALEAVGAKAEVLVSAIGPDIARGWGLRRTVALDFLADDPVQPGSRRIGPDLANVGLRRPDASWQLRHLYAPRAEVQDSTMPPYRFLFEMRKIGPRPAPDALQLPAPFAPPAGYEIVPKPEAHALVAYLLSLRADAPLFEMPVMALPAAAPSTNAPPAAASAK
jgi:cbb3-type cytochrome oxidase cytochrome c subunit